MVLRVFKVSPQDLGKYLGRYLSSLLRRPASGPVGGRQGTRQQKEEPERERRRHRSTYLEKRSREQGGGRGEGREERHWKVRGTSDLWYLLHSPSSRKKLARPRGRRKLLLQRDATTTRAQPMAAHGDLVPLEDGPSRPHFARSPSSSTSDRRLGRVPYSAPLTELLLRTCAR